MALGYWYKTGLDENEPGDVRSFAVRLRLNPVLAEVYRTDSTKFLPRRDSILTLYSR